MIKKSIHSVVPTTCPRHGGPRVGAAGFSGCTCSVGRVYPRDADSPRYEVIYGHEVMAPEQKTVLQEAEEIVDGARRESYGTPKENHTRTAEMWSAYLGIEISARQVCMLNVLQKVSRDAHKAGRDHLVDIIGYVRNIELLDQ